MFRVENHRPMSHKPPLPKTTQRFATADRWQVEKGDFRSIGLLEQTSQHRNLARMRPGEKPFHSSPVTNKTGLAAQQPAGSFNEHLTGGAAGRRGWEIAGVPKQAKLVGNSL